MQPQGHVQMVVRMCDYGQNPQAAADAPRWQVLRGGAIALEDGVPDDVAAELARRGHRIRPAGQFGGAQIIVRTPAGYVAASDPRKDGQAVGV
jgi:gamma-glutamyltranspeptidase/glutathione hydrolase